MSLPLHSPPFYFYTALKIKQYIKTEKKKLGEITRVAPAPPKSACFEGFEGVLALSWSAAPDGMQIIFDFCPS